MQIDRSMKTGIASSLIATVVFLYLLDPVLSFSARLLFRTIPDAYADRLFKEIATGNPDFAYEVIVLVFSASTVLSLIVAFKSQLPRAARLVAERKNLRRSLEGSMRVLAALMIWLALFHSFDGYVRLRIRSSFEQHLAILAPVLHDDGVVRVRAAFASMTSRSDYERLRAQLSAVAKANGLALPPNRLYPGP